MGLQHFPGGPDHPENWPSRKTVKTDGLRGILRCSDCGTPKKALWRDEDLVGIYCEYCDKRQARIDHHNREHAARQQAALAKKRKSTWASLLAWAALFAAVSILASTCN